MKKAQKRAILPSRPKAKVPDLKPFIDYAPSDAQLEEWKARVRRLLADDAARTKV